MGKVIGILLLIICGIFTGQAMAKREREKYQNGEKIICLMRCMLQSVKIGQRDVLMYAKNQKMLSQWDFFTIFTEKVSQENSVKLCYFTAKKAVNLALLPELEQQAERFFTEFGTLGQDIQLNVCEMTISVCSQILQACKRESFVKAELFRKVVPLCFAAIAVLFV